MKSVYESSTRNELVSRISTLSPQHQALWGMMNVFQMVKHCTMCEDMLHGKIKIRRVFIGRLIGKMILKKVLKDDAPFRRNSPSAPVLITTGTSGDMEEQKNEWINRIESYASYNDPHFIHPFFGPMTKEQIGLFAYKHADHHLRQFGV